MAFVLRLVIDLWRADERRPRLIGDDDTVAAQAVGDRADELVDAYVVAQALARLSPQHRAVIDELYYRGATVTEAAPRRARDVRRAAGPAARRGTVDRGTRGSRQRPSRRGLCAAGPAPRVTDEPSGTTLALTAPADGRATGETSLSAKPWGTSVDLDVQGLPQGEQFVVWLVSPSGERQQAATWASTSNGEAHVTGAAALAPQDVVHVRVTDSDGELLLSTATR